jgi:hypothetical protein
VQMLDRRTFYREMIEARATRAASLAAEQGYGSAIKGSLLEIFDEHASASVLFRSDHIVLEQLTIDVRQRRRHYGSSLLETVIAIADREQLRLELIAEPPMHPIMADLSQGELQAWYRRHRFVDTDDVLMSRLPEHAAHQVPAPPIPAFSLLWAGRLDRFVHYARNGFAYSEAASAAFYGVALHFFSDWCDFGIAAVDRLNRTYRQA